MKINKRTLLIMACDFAIALVCYALCAIVGPHTPQKDFIYRLMLMIPTLLILYPLVNSLLGVYRVIHRYAQAKEYLRFFASFMIAGFLMVIINHHRCLPKLLGFTGYGVYFLFELAVTTASAMIIARMVYRVYHDRKKPGQTGTGKKTLIVGCGQACLMLLNDIGFHPECGILPVTCVDTDESKIGRDIAGIRIEGTDKDIRRLCEKYGIEMIIIAIPSADNACRAAILEQCAGINAEIKMLPRVSDFNSSDTPVVEKLRDFTMEEVLGREPIEMDNKNVNDFIRGKTVLITGGGGSIGSELCRQVAAASPKKLIILDIYENNAYSIQQELAYSYKGKLDFDTIIASVRDHERINAIMADYHPDLVIHAAAHKHVPLMEVAPQEAIKNNVFGTYNTARAAINNHVAKFVLISTDKAVNPTNVMGASKRICEMVIQSLNGRGTDFCAVRFGNVLGSNGSVIPLFKKQIAHGGPVTVTHPDIIRFFMTIPEAVRLVLLAGATAKGGEIFVLNMGSPVKIDDLARRIIQLSGKKPDIDIKIEYTGLRPGEKLYEELMMDNENLEKTQSDKIFIGHFVDFDKNALEFNLAALRKIAFNNFISQEEMNEDLVTEITRIVPTFNHQTN